MTTVLPSALMAAALTFCRGVASCQGPTHLADSAVAGSAGFDVSLVFTAAFSTGATSLVEVFDFHFAAACLFVLLLFAHPTTSASALTKTMDIARFIMPIPFSTAFPI